MNRFPGCACDVPSHAYSFNFALNVTVFLNNSSYRAQALYSPNGPCFFSYAEDIQKYLERVVGVFDLQKYMHFNSEVIGSYWDEEKGKWTVKIVQTRPDGTKVEFQDTCDLLLQATGVLSHPKWPNIEGLSECKGKVSSGTAILPLEIYY